MRQTAKKRQDPPFAELTWQARFKAFTPAELKAIYGK
jgi:hypothetical protein